MGFLPSLKTSASQPLRSSPTVFLLSLGYAECVSTSGPLHLLFLLFGKHFSQIYVAASFSSSGLISDVTPQRPALNPPVERKTFMEVKVPKLGVGWGRARELPPTLTTKQKYLQRAR